MRRSLLVCLLALACVQESKPSVDSKPTEKPAETGMAGKVDGHPIMAAEIENRVQAQVAQFQVAGRKITPDFTRNTRRAIFQFLVDQELVAQEGQRQGLQITDDALDQAIATFKDRFGTPEGFAKYLRTIQRTAEEWREDHRGRLLRDRVLNQLVGEVTVDEAAVKAHFEKHPDRFVQREQVRAAQILVPFGQSKGPHGRQLSSNGEKKVPLEQNQKALKEALRLKTQASRPGVAFGQLARREGKDHRAAAGGDLGWFPRGRHPKPVEDAVFGAKIGQVLGPIKSRFGYHVVKLIDRRPEGRKGFKEVRKELHDELIRRRRGRARRDALTTLRGKATIEILNPALERTAPTALPQLPKKGH